MVSVFHRIDVAASNASIFQTALSNDGLFYTLHDSNQRILFGSIFNSNQDPTMIVHGTKATTEITRLKLGYEEDMVKKQGILDTNRALNFLKGDIGNGSNGILEWLQYHGGGSNHIVDIDHSKECLYVTGTFGSNVMRLYDRTHVNALYTLMNSNNQSEQDASSIYIAAYTGSDGAYLWSTSITARIPSRLEAQALRSTPANDRFYVAGTYESRTGESGQGIPQQILFSLESNMTLDISGLSNGSFLGSYTYQKEDAENFPQMNWSTLLPGHCRDLDGNQDWIVAIGNQSAASNAYVRAYNASGSQVWHTEFSSNNVIPYAVRIHDCSESVYVAVREGFGQTGLYTFGLSHGMSLRPPQFIHAPAVSTGSFQMTLAPQNTYMTFDTYCDLYVLDSFNQSIKAPSSPYTINPYESNATLTQDILLTKMNSNGSTLWFARGSGHGHDVASCVYTSPYGDVYFTGHYQNKIDLYDGFGAFHESIVNESSSNTDAAVICKLSRQGHFIYAMQIEGVSENYPTMGVCDALGNMFIAGTQGSAVLTMTDATQKNPQTLLSRVSNAHCEGFIVKYDHDSYYYLLTDEFRPEDTGIELSFLNTPTIPNSKRRCFVSLGKRPNPLTPISNVDPYTLSLEHVYQIHESMKLSLAWYGGYWRMTTRDIVTRQDITVRSLSCEQGWGGTGSLAGGLGGLISSFTAAANPVDILGMPKYFVIGNQLYPPVCMPYAGRIMAVSGTMTPGLSTLPDSNGTWMITFAIRNLITQQLSTITEDGLETDLYTLVFTVGSNDRVQIGAWGQSPRIPYAFPAGAILVWEVIDIRGNIPVSLPTLTMWTQFA